MTLKNSSRQAGFSLVELLVAMVITMIVTASIFTLLSSGEGAFKVQPERTDIQQNGRSAMDMIMSDISSAGVSMPNFTQVFTPGLNACAGCPNGGSPMGVIALTPIANPTTPEVADELEMVTNPENFPNETVCNTLGATPGVQNGTNPVLQRNPPIFTTFPVGVIIVTTGTSNPPTAANTPPLWAAQQVTGYSGGPGPCTGTQQGVTFTSGGACAVGPAPTFGTALGASAATCSVASISLGAVVHYRIRPDPVDGIPCLWRLSTKNLAAGYQIVARGIDDMQVQYVQANGAVSDPAPPVVQANFPPVQADFAQLVTQVRVRLSARSTLRGNIQGQTTVSGTSALRSQIGSTGSPRAALFALTQQAGTPQWH